MYVEAIQTSIAQTKISGSAERREKTFEEIHNYLSELQNIDIPPIISMDAFQASRCPKGFVDIDLSGGLPYCFKLYMHGLSWKEASDECERIGSSLPTMTTINENRRVSEMLKKFGTSLNWIGLHLLSKCIQIIRQSTFV